MNLTQMISQISLGEWIILILVFFIVVETIIVLISNREYMLGTFGVDDGNINREVSEYSSKALNLAAITFAAISLIIAGMLTSINLSNTVNLNSSMTIFKDILIVFAFGFLLFVISFKLEVFGATKRIYWSLQQRLLNFGIIALVFGVSLFFIVFLSQSYILMFFIGLTILILVLVHFKEFLCDYNDCIDNKQKTECEEGNTITIKTADIHLLEGESDKVKDGLINKVSKSVADDLETPIENVTVTLEYRKRK